MDCFNIAFYCLYLCQILLHFQELRIKSHWPNSMKSIHVAYLDWLYFFHYHFWSITSRKKYIFNWAECHLYAGAHCKHENIMFSSKPLFCHSAHIRTERYIKTATDKKCMVAIKHAYCNTMLDLKSYFIQRVFVYAIFRTNHHGICSRPDFIRIKQQYAHKI